MFSGTGTGKSHESCSGCGVCLLSCPVWHLTNSMSFTRKARARAVQGGASYEEISSSIDSCLLCGACEPACPEGIGLADLNIHQRQELNRRRTKYPDWYPQGNVQIKSVQEKLPQGTSAFLPGELIGRDHAVHQAVMELLQGNADTSLAHDDGQDIARLTEAGLPVSPPRIDSFISTLGQTRTLIVAEGWLHRLLRKWLPNRKILGLGEALLSAGPLRRMIGKEDLYIIESRGYHADHKRLVLFYDRLRGETGCQTNLDLQRTAFSTGASSLQGRKDMLAAGCIENAKRILRGRKVRRVIVEDLADAGAFRLAADIPVVHLGLLAREDGLS